MTYKPRNAARELINLLFHTIWKAIKKLLCNSNKKQNGKHGIR